MFKKKPNFKSLAPLRSSDRRKLVDQIIKEYQLEVPQESEGGDERNHSTGINVFRNSLLPDGALSANFTTTAGTDLKLVKGTIYVGAHPGEEQRILWIKLDSGKIVPTVYTLWRHPQIVPLLHTPDIVIQKMQEGADLNIPGLARGPPFPARAVEGAAVAIARYENPSVPVVLGICEIDVASLKEVRGQKGHAVRPIHWEGDEAWDWSQNSQGGRAGPEQIQAWYSDEMAGIEESTQGLEVGDDPRANDDEDGGVALVPDSLWSAQTSKPQNGENTGTEAPVAKEWTTPEIDDAFRKAFLYACHHAKQQDKTEPHHGIDFPVTQSRLISDMISPYLPIHTPEDAAALQMKKTSWKNAKKFIKTLDKQLLLKSKDRNGGETVILDIDFNDQSIVGFTPYRLPKKQSAGAEAGGAAAGASSGAADISLGQKLKRVTLLKPKAAFAPIFAGSDAKSYYLPQEIKPVVTHYVEEEALIDPKNKRLVSLNPVLANAIFDSSSSIDREVLAKGTVPREALIDRVIQGCSSYWAILRNDESKDDVKPKAGQPPNVKIQLETRTGNKTATKVWGIEVFHIHPQALAEELQKACASSTSVGQQVGSSPKAPIMEIMVQGPQKDIIIKALEKRGLRKEWVEVIDKTKSKKK